MRKKKPKKPVCNYPTSPVLPPSKNPILDFVRNFFTGANGNLRKAVTGLMLSSAVLRWPWLVSWMGEPITNQVLVFADLLKTTAWPVILLFMKQYNVTGGTKPVQP